MHLRNRSLATRGNRLLLDSSHDPNRRDFLQPNAAVYRRALARRLALPVRLRPEWSGADPSP